MIGDQLIDLKAAPFPKANMRFGVKFPTFMTVLSCKRVRLEASQLIINHYYLERKGMLSVNGQSSECRGNSDRSEADRAMADLPRADRRMVKGRSCDGD